MKLSCIMALNRYDFFVYESIESILNQTYKNFELLILVNGNPDIEKSIKEQFSDPRIKIYHSPIEQLAYNLNKGLELARGEYISRMDSDDIAVENRFEKQIHYLDSNINITVVSSLAHYIDSNGNEINMHPKLQSINNVNEAFWYCNPIIHPSVMFRKNIIIKAKGYSEILNEDYELWLRLLRTESKPFHVMQEKLIKYRIHDGQSRGSWKSYSTSTAIIFKEFLITKNFLFLIGTFIFLLKTLLRSKN